MGVVRNWAKICGLPSCEDHRRHASEIRGAENIPPGAALVASKHQSSFETFALIPLLKNPTIVMKRSIRWLPIFGQYTIKTGMIHVDREGKTPRSAPWPSAPARKSPRAARSSSFPEGTRGARRGAARISDRHRAALPHSERAGSPGGAEFRPLSGRDASSSTIPARSSWSSCRPSLPVSIRATFLTQACRATIETASTRLMAEGRGRRRESAEQPWLRTRFSPNSTLFLAKFHEINCMHNKCSMFVLMVAVLPPLLSDQPPEVPQRVGLGDRFHYFRGHSGRRYLFSAVPQDELADFRYAVVVLARPAGNGRVAAHWIAVLDLLGRPTSSDRRWPPLHERRHDGSRPSAVAQWTTERRDLVADLSARPVALAA